MSSKRKKILIFKLGLLGDVLMTTPFVRQLRRMNPDADIQYWVGQSFSVALRDNPHLSSIHPFDEKIFLRHRFLKFLTLWRALRKERFDEAFFLGKHWIFNALAFSLLIPRRLGFTREAISRVFLTDTVRFRDLRHEVHYYLDLLSLLAPVDYCDSRMEAHVSPEDETRAGSLIEALNLEGFAAVINSGGNNAGESKFVRRLPCAFFERLVFTLLKSGPAVLLGNAADREYYEKFKFPKGVHNLAGTLSFHQSLAVMKMCRRVYSTDCGGLHMAATVNDHITAFFGPAHPERKAPFLPDIEIVWPDRDRYNPEYDLYNTSADEKSFAGLTYRLNGETLNTSPPAFVTACS